MCVAQYHNCFLTSNFGKFITWQCSAKNIQIHHISVELVIIPVTVVGNLVRVTRRFVKLSPRSKWSATHHSAVSVKEHISRHVVPGDCYVRPVTKWKFSTYNLPPHKDALVAACKSQLTVFDEKTKLPWRLPIVIDCPKSFWPRLFYPAANGKTPAVKGNYWGGSE